MSSGSLNFYAPPKSGHPHNEVDFARLLFWTPRGFGQGLNLDLLYVADNIGNIRQPGIERMVFNGVEVNKRGCLLARHGYMALHGSTKSTCILIWMY